MVKDCRSYGKTHKEGKTCTSPAMMYVDRLHLIDSGKKPGIKYQNHDSVHGLYRVMYYPGSKISFFGFVHEMTICNLKFWS